MINPQKPKRNSIHREKLSRLTRARQERLEKVANLYLRGKSFRTIGELVGVSLAQVQRDLNLCKQEWAKATSLSIRALASQELARLDRIEAEAWRAWERSQQPMTERLRETTSSLEEKTTKRAKRTKQGPGDPSFLTIAIGCVSQRLKIADLVTRDNGRSSDDIVVQAIEVIVENREEAQKMLTYEQFRRMTGGDDKKSGSR